GATGSGQGDKAGLRDAKSFRQAGDLFLSPEEPAELGRQSGGRRDWWNERHGAGRPVAADGGFLLAPRLSERLLFHRGSGDRRLLRRRSGARDDDAAGVPTELVSEGARHGGRDIAQLLPQQPLQLLILPQGGGGLAGGGIQPHQIVVRLLPQRVRADRS